MLDWAIQGGRIAADSSTKKYDRDELTALGLVGGDGLSDLARRLLEEIDQDHFTRTPPSANDQIHTCVNDGETFRESEERRFER